MNNHRTVWCKDFYESVLSIKPNHFCEFLGREGTKGSQVNEKINRLVYIKMENSPMANTEKTRKTQLGRLLIIDKGVIFLKINKRDRYANRKIRKCHE